VRQEEVSLHGYGDAFILTATVVPPFSPGSGRSDKRGNLEYRTSHEVLDVSLRAEPHLYVALTAVY
jgi:hypothetical protein